MFDGSKISGSISTKSLTPILTSCSATGEPVPPRPTIATLVFVNVLTERLFHSFWRFARLFDRATEASEGAERLVKLSCEETSIADPGGKIDVRYPVSINLKNVCFSYGEDYSNEEGAIHNLDLDIEGGKICAIVGKSGAGKTTIRKLVTRLLDIQGGEIFVGGIEVRNWPLNQLRGLFSYVPQGDDVFIYSGTARENISLSKPDASLADVRQAARFAGIDDFIANYLPEGYETYLGERGKKLSGGQKQRIALARAILADRPILILDEATSQVDAITEQIIQDQMKTILAGKTAIVVAHRFSTIRNLAVKIVVLENGCKVEEGSHEELKRLGGLYAEMFKRQNLQ